MLADTQQLHKVLQNRVRWYRHQHGREPSTRAIAQLLGNTLYYRRFFPYYAFNVLGGVDEDGAGICFSYDAVGCFEAVKYSSSGTGNELVQPLLDNQMGWKEQRAPGALGPVTMEAALELVQDAFTSAGERDMYTGDHVDIFVVTKEGTRQLRFDLKAD
eukprot:TRINITY_DN20263_c0_g1_i1.p3 TRINITY_DN20263_c0_g1~~TRINITY_DN20263_c0_g1_i1.p3  ORF type:complete len:159 (-),score=56.66 TRINITY_DN20263_c0_g1_i1:57-533(-)